MPTRILVLGPSWLGDAVMAIPTYRALRRAFPDAWIAVLARGPVADLYRMVEGVDEVVPYRRPRGPRRLGAYVDLVRRLQRVRADVAVLLPRSFGAAWTALLADVPRRVGYAASGRAWILTDPIERAPALLRTHRVHYLQHVLTGLGLEPAPEAPVLTIPDDTRAAADRLLAPLTDRAPTRLVAFNPGANYGGAKQWPEERYVELARALLAREDLGIVLVGAPGDHPVCDRIVHEVGDPRLLDLSGETTVCELAAVLDRCDYAVSNDTGAMHVAAAVGTPIVAIFGPTDPVTTPPYGDAHRIVREPVECSPCLLRECPIDHRCMTRVDVDRVLAECDEIAARVPAPARPRS